LHRPPAFRWFQLQFAKPVVSAGVPNEPPRRLTRNEAITRIMAEGKVPGTKDYPAKNFVIEVSRLCGVDPEKTRGYDRRTLRDIYNDLKRKSE
jgi:hypothetical protein